MSEEKLSKEECLRLLETEFKNWNKGQKSLDLAMRGVRSSEDDLLDMKRKLLEKVYKRLMELT